MRLPILLVTLTTFAETPELPTDRAGGLTTYAIPLRVVGNSLREADSLIRAQLTMGPKAWLRQVARSWVDRPYGSGGQGVSAQELLVNLQQMDCMTAVENLMAMQVAGEWYRRGLLSPEEAFVQALMRVRYESYPPCRWEDRYHYLTHAFAAWEANGWGSWLPLGKPDRRSIRYMSQHRQQYKGFTDWKKIQAVEKSLSTRPRFWIPEVELGEWLPLLQDGDLVAFIPSDSLLDVAHVGIFFWEGGKATFAHASSAARKWVWGEDLCAYLDRREKVIGITVFRPFERLSCDTW